MKMIRASCSLAPFTHNLIPRSYYSWCIGLRVLALLLSSATTAYAATNRATCIWHAESNSCSWNVLYPLSQLSQATASSSVLDNNARNMLEAAYLLDLCATQGNVNQSSCTSALHRGAPACRWGSPVRPTSAFVTPDTMCTPANTAFLEQLLNVTAPDSCGREDHANEATCTASIKCKWEEHADSEGSHAGEEAGAGHEEEHHGECWINWMYIQQWLGGENETLAVEANRAQHLCAPETVSLSHEEGRPNPLNKTQCEAVGMFSLSSARVARLAVAAGVPGVMLSDAVEPITSVPDPSPATPQGQASTPLATVPSCQLINRTSCVPNLVALASVSDQLGPAMSARTRELLGYSQAALRCLSFRTDASSELALQDCTRAALLNPSLLDAAFTPTCTDLSEDQCKARPGCTLEAHAGHKDCVRSAQHVAQYLADTSAGGKLQGLADSCRVSVASCGRSSVILTRGNLAALSTVLSASGNSSSPAPGLVDPPVGDSPTSEQHHEDDDTLGLRIGSIFVIFIAGSCGCAIPILFKGFLEQNSLLTHVIRSLSAGVILCLALVHVITHAVEEMEGLLKPLNGEDSEHDGHGHRRLLLQLTPDDIVWQARRLLQEDSHAEESSGGGHNHAYPIAMTCVLFGFILVVLFEHLSHILHDRLSGGAALHSHGSMCSHGADHQAHKQVAVEMSSPRPVAESSGDQSAIVISPSDMKAHSVEYPHGMSSAGVNAVGFSRSSLTTRTTSPFRLQVLALLFEIGCVFHSFIIGMGLGVSLQYSEVRALLLALTFHQFLEGISLGTIISNAGFPLWKQAIMSLVYALTCPIGVAVGIGISSSYEPDSTAAKAVQGTLNGVAGGMLLYLGMALVLTEFGDGERVPTSHRVVSFGVMVLGAALMAMLAIWA